MSNEITRFTPEQVGQFVVMNEDKNGDYVNYEDYLLLLGKHNAVMRDLTSLQMVPKSEYDKLLEANVGKVGYPESKQLDGEKK